MQPSRPSIWLHDSNETASGKAGAVQIAYLFSTRYVHGTSLTWRGVLGTKAVIIGVALVVVGQLAFTYAPVMNRLFESRPVQLHDGLVIIMTGTIALLVFETEKRLIRRLQGI